VVTGQIVDDYYVDSVEICLDADCRVGNPLNLSQATDYVVSDVPVAPISINGATSCAGTPIVRTFNVDTNFSVWDVSLRFAITHALRDDIRATLRSPAGTEVQVVQGDGVVGTNFQNLMVTYSDSAETGHYSYRADDLTMINDGRNARPYEPLQKFRDETAQGVWTLEICDRFGALDDGNYLASELVLTPYTPLQTTAIWTFIHPNEDDSNSYDGITRTLKVRGIDAVGNITETLGVPFLMDNVAPVLTITQQTAATMFAFDVPALTGQARDGDALAGIYVTVLDPDGDVTTLSVEPPYDTWAFSLPASKPGNYELSVGAFDRAGNLTTAGPFRVSLLTQPPYSIWLPLMFQNYQGGQGEEPIPEYVDLTTSLRVTPEKTSYRAGEAVALTVVITNEGTIASDAFWVDFYINPESVPMEPNQPWNELCTLEPCFGLVWLVESLAPGERIELSSAPNAFLPEYSNWPGWFANGTQDLYVLVDSWNPDQLFGNVAERSEVNNLSGVLGLSVVGNNPSLGRLPAKIPDR
jgi:subtilisin-like proprotein convertase family protein